MASHEIRFINESADPRSIVIFQPGPGPGVLAWRVIQDAAPGYEERFVFPSSVLGVDVLAEVVPGQVITDDALSGSAATFQLDGIRAADLVLRGGDPPAFSLRNVQHG